MLKKKTGRKPLNIAGYRFGSLVAIKRVGVKNKNSVWNCMCDCGRTTNVRVDKLKTLRTKSCGKCEANIKDISGKSVGKLIVLGFSHRDNGKYFWRCRCECGNEILVRRKILVRKSITSCGCHRIKDISGERFGKLIVKYIDKVVNNSAYWVCRCDCGVEKSIHGHSLRRGATISCGCANHITQDIVARLASEILRERPESDYRNIEWLINPETGRRLEIDIYFPISKIAIEYDGEFHFYNRRFSQERTNKQKHRDLVKNNLIRDHIKNGGQDIKKFIRFSFLEDITKELVESKIYYEED